LEIFLPAGKKDRLLEAMTEATGGRCRIEEKESLYAEVKEKP
jgi:hypothetical protein